jgi:deoxycytidine triphosphate deaminase
VVVTPTPASPPTTLLRRRIKDPDDPFMVTPMPPSAAISHGSIDLQLGNTFLVAIRASVPSVSAREPQRSRQLFSEVRCAPDDKLIIQPHQFVLAATMEYICLPVDLCGFLQSRSTYGRLGLISATATYVTAGYRGCPTLEISNVGEVPVEVYPGDPICQLVLFTADEDPADLKPSRYQCATRPYAARGT